jgi:hypothetical protein
MTYLLYRDVMHKAAGQIRCFKASVGSYNVEVEHN